MTDQAPRIKTLADVQRAIAAGVSAQLAIKQAFEEAGHSAVSFGLKFRVNRYHISRVLARREAPTERMLAGLTRAFGGSPEEWALLLWESQKPVQTAAGGE